jgi:hypothetical protein
MKVLSFELISQEFKKNFLKLFINIKYDLVKSTPEDHQIKARIREQLNLQISSTLSTC